MGRFDETVENLTRVRSLERKRAKRAADRAMGSISIGLAPSAQSMMKSAVKLPEMNRPNDLAFIAMAQYRLGRPEAANETYRELVELMKADESPSENALFAETQIVLQILPEQATQPVTK
jgi:hypothetical protein